MPMSKESPPAVSGIPLVILWLVRIELAGWLVASIGAAVLALLDPCTFGAGCCGGSHSKTAKKDIANLMSSAEMYQLAEDRCPESIVDLREAGIIAKITKDPWGHDYAFTCAGAGGHVLIMSAGPDGRFGSKDDIHSWDADP